MALNRGSGRLRRAVVATAVLYPVALVGVILAMRFVGERWWVTTVLLYLPRLAFAAPLPFIVVGLLAGSARGWLWTQIISAVLLGFPLMGLVVGLPRVGGVKTPTVRVLSYNVDKGHGGAENLAEEVRRFSPDVVVMQEIDVSGDKLVRAFQSSYATVEVSGQFFIASRFPIVSSVKAEPLSMRLDGLRHYHAYLLDTPIGRLRLISVRPTSPSWPLIDLRQKGLSGRNLGSALEVLDWNSRLRELEARTIAEAAAQSVEPVVIAGDTNLPDLSRILGRYLSPFDDAFAEAGSGFGYTFPSGRMPWMRIDRILTGRGLRAVGFLRGTSALSDHLCVVGDIARAE
jgi:endonuclease/exonuclease/phosphatase family metal-dependent hydrolase